MAIDQSDIIDFIGTDKNTGAVGLLINDHLEWDLEKQTLIKDKVNAYLDYIESGQLTQAYPDAQGRKVYIELVHHVEPTEVGLSILAKVKQIVEEGGVGFTWSQWVDDQAAQED